MVPLTPHLAFAAALAITLVALAPAPVRAQAESREDSGPSKPATQGPVAAPDSAPRPTQIEPIVAPVKRSQPKTPELEEATKPKPEAKSGKPSSKESKPKKTSRPVVPARPNCDPGFKVDAAGKSCVKPPANTSSKKKR